MKRIGIEGKAGRGIFGRFMAVGIGLLLASCGEGNAPRQTEETPAPNEFDPIGAANPSAISAQGDSAEKEIPVDEAVFYSEEGKKAREAFFPLREKPREVYEKLKKGGKLGSVSFADFIEFSGDIEGRFINRVRSDIEAASKTFPAFLGARDLNQVPEYAKLANEAKGFLIQTKSVAPETGERSDGNLLRSGQIVISFMRADAAPVARPRETSLSSGFWETTSYPADLTIRVAWNTTDERTLNQVIEILRCHVSRLDLLYANTFSVQALRRLYREELERRFERGEIAKCCQLVRAVSDLKDGASGPICSRILIETSKNAAPPLPQSLEFETVMASAFAVQRLLALQSAPALLEWVRIQRRRNSPRGESEFIQALVRLNPGFLREEMIAMAKELPIQDSLFRAAVKIGAEKAQAVLGDRLLKKIQTPDAEYSLAAELVAEMNSAKGLELLESRAKEGDPDSILALAQNPGEAEFLCAIARSLPIKKAKDQEAAEEALTRALAFVSEEKYPVFRELLARLQEEKDGKKLEFCAETLTLLRLRLIKDRVAVRLLVSTDMALSDDLGLMTKGFEYDEKNREAFIKAMAAWRVEFERGERANVPVLRE